MRLLMVDGQDVQGRKAGFMIFPTDSMIELVGSFLGKWLYMLKIVLHRAKSFSNLPIDLCSILIDSRKSKGATG